MYAHGKDAKSLTGLECNRNRQLTVEGLKELQKIVDMDQITRRLISETIMKITHPNSVQGQSSPLWVKEINYIEASNQAAKAAED